MVLTSAHNIFLDAIGHGTAGEWVEIWPTERLLSEELEEAGLVETRLHPDGLREVRLVFEGEITPVWTSEH